MRWSKGRRPRARWRRDCHCESCTTRRAESMARASAAGVASRCGTPDDVDEMAVERALSGDPPRLTRAERREVTRILTARGYSATQIASRLRTSPRTVIRYRAELRIPP